MKNPCSCKAWIEFARNRDKLQNQTKELLEALDYREKNYRFNPEVRKQIKYLYANMPEKKPSEGWYQRVIDTLK
jgi:RNA polymerase sigma-70 factor (ECF subfamily)